MQGAALLLQVGTSITFGALLDLEYNRAFGVAA